MKPDKQNSKLPLIIGSSIGILLVLVVSFVTASLIYRRVKLRKCKSIPLKATQVINSANTEYQLTSFDIEINDDNNDKKKIRLSVYNYSWAPLELSADMLDEEGLQVPNVVSSRTNSADDLSAHVENAEFDMRNFQATSAV